MRGPHDGVSGRGDASLGGGPTTNGPALTESAGAAVDGVDRPIVRGVSDRAVGWAFVAVQIVVLGALVVLPGRDDWPTPIWVEVIGLLAVVVGLLIVVVGGRGLGSALTPTPVPRADIGGPATSGAFAHVRHPIYSGVLLIVVGVVIRSGSLVTLVVGLATIGFFHVKARWEERRLTDAYPGYAEYAERTPRFVPSIRRRSEVER